jgi:large subunit ribosomal protein L7Ae|tara:strand:+ start:11599 stop:11937 length:339 start_codon:yes stop_codon:yes gene_type:complete
MAEQSDELLRKVYEAIELARKTGKIKKGTNETTKAVERGTAKLVVVAKDVNPPEITMHIKPLCAEKKVPHVDTATREELGVAAGLNVPTTSVAIVQEGEAADIIKTLAKELN